MNQLKLILNSTLAGLCIDVGGLLFIVSQYLLSLTNDYEIYLTNLFKLIGSIAFSIGLFTICYFKLNLYTGKIGLVIEGSVDINLFSLFAMLILNLISSGIFGICCHYLFSSYASKIVSIVSNISIKRIELTNFDDYVKSFINSFLCGSCVYLAVKSFQKHKSLLVFFITWFVYCGYEHCIADSFYYCFAFVTKQWKKALISILINVVGNSIGTIPVIYLFKHNDGCMTTSSQSSIEQSSNESSTVTNDEV